MRTDLKGTQLLIASNEIPPYLSFNGSESNRLEGIEAHIINTLSDILNFTYQFVDCDYKWGKLGPNNTWDGIIGKQVDFGIAGVTMNEIRYRSIRFTYPHYVDSISFTSPQPVPNGYSLLLLRPFSRMFWITFLIFLIMNYLFDLMVKKLTSTDFLINWNVIAIVLGQSLNSKFSLSVRSLLCGWLLSSMILRVHYSGCLYTSMTFPQESDTIETINELALAQKNHKIQTVMLEGTAYASDSNSTLIVNREFQNSIKSVNTYPEAHNLLKAYPKKYVFIAERMGTEYNIREKGLLFYLPPITKDSNVFLDIISIAVSKNFQYITQFNEIIFRIQNAGLIELWKKRFYWKHFGTNYTEFIFLQSDEELQGLDLDQLENAFYLWLSGLLFSSLICLSEYYINGLHPKYRNRLYPKTKYPKPINSEPITVN